MNPTFDIYPDRARVETMQACRNLGIARNTLYSYARTLGIVKVPAKVGKSFWWGKDINRIGNRAL